MKILIVEDELTSRIILQELLSPFGELHVAINGEEATEAVGIALEKGEPYDLICLDIMMPRMDGQQALERIRSQEEERGILSTRGSKIIMTTSVDDLDNVSRSYKYLCDSYLTKPISGKKLHEELRKLNLLSGKLEVES